LFIDQLNHAGQDLELRRILSGSFGHWHH